MHLYERSANRWFIETTNVGVEQRETKQSWRQLKGSLLQFERVRRSWRVVSVMKNKNMILGDKVFAKQTCRKPPSSEALWYAH